MLPVTIQFLIAMVAYAIDERMARRVEYLQEEVRVLREMLVTKTGRRRIAFTDDQRLRLATKGKALTPEERSACCQIVQPDTLLKWLRQLAAKKYDNCGFPPDERLRPFCVEPHRMPQQCRTARWFLHRHDPGLLAANC